MRPLRSLVGRIGVAIRAVVFIAAPGITMLDAVYHATVTLTTTGYGDITPVSPAAGAVTAFIVKPVRVVFLVVLIGTTLAFLTER